MIEISVVIPAYNVADYIQECIDSVLNQTFHKKIEIICIDDKSTDHTLEIIKKYINNKHVRILQNTSNMGLSYTRNRGLDEARGKYIYFLDGDDKIVDTAFDMLYDIAEDKRLECIFFSAKLFFDKGFDDKSVRNYVSTRKGFYNQVLKGTKLFEQFAYNNEWSSSVPRQFWSRKFLVEHKLYFYQGILHEDQLFSFKALLSCNRTICINESLALRRFRNNSITTVSVSPEHIRGLLICLNEMTQFWMSQEYSQSTNKVIYNHLRGFRHSIKKKVVKMEKIELSSLQMQFLKDLFLESPIPEYCIEIDALFVEKLKGKRLIIYGAGEIAKEVINKLSLHDIIIDRVIVSDVNKSRKSIIGHKVYQFDETVDSDKESIVLLSVSKKYHNEIISLLKGNGYDTIIVMASR